MIAGLRQGGYAKYPSWITRDWDPLVYGYPNVPDESWQQRNDGVHVFKEGWEIKLKKQFNNWDRNFYMCIEVFQQNEES